MGLEFIELQLEDPYTPAEMIRGGTSRRLGRILDEHGIELVLHGPVHDVNLASLKEPIRRASVDILKSCIDVVHLIGGDSIAVHCGKCPADQIRMLEVARQRLYASLHEIATYAAEHGVRIGIENKQHGRDREIVLYPDEQRVYVESIREFGGFAVVDIGHANTTEVAPVDYLRTLGDLVEEVHLHDNRGAKDDHLPLGSGTVPLRDVLMELRSFSGRVVLEVKDLDGLHSSLRVIEETLLTEGVQH